MALGFLVPNWLDFTNNMLAELAGFALALAAAVALIEGPILTRERRRQKAISKQASSINAMVGEISALLSSEAFVLILDELVEQVLRQSPDVSDFTEYRKVMLATFESSRSFPEEGTPLHPNLTEDSYQEFIAGVNRFINGARKRLQGDYDVQSVLAELIEALDELDRHAYLAIFPNKLKYANTRFRTVGEIGCNLLKVNDVAVKAGFVNI